MFGISKICIFFIISFTSLLHQAHSQEILKYTNDGMCISQMKNGKINWTEGKITAIGKAAPPNKEKKESSNFILNSAKIDAKRNLIHIFKNMSLKTGLSVQDYASHSDLIMAGIERVVMDANIKEQRYTSDRAIEVSIEMSLFGVLLQFILPEDIKQIPNIKIIKPDEHNTKKEQYTGLIIDAGGLDFEPVIYPVIVSEDGQLVYSSIFISREYAVQKGVCQYVCDLNTALTAKRIGNNPILIKGLRKSSSNNASIVISRSDSNKIEQLTERHFFMKQCKVIILLGNQ